jgi:hypothetical protein
VDRGPPAGPAVCRFDLKAKSAQGPADELQAASN